jgi:hypothetical protein
MMDIDWYRRPELILSELLHKAARHESERQYYRASVLAVDLDGGKLQNPDGAGEVSVVLRDGTIRRYAALTGPANPRGSIKARIITDGFDRLLDDQSLRVFWPMFPQDMAGTPVTPGEHVYVMFEGDGMSHGIWVSRVAGHESANSSQGALEYDAPSHMQSAMDSFEPNLPEYPRDDEYASLAPSEGAIVRFGDG